MHIFCPECGKHIDVSHEELENQKGHLVCPQCLAEIDVEVDLFNDKGTTSQSDFSNNAHGTMPTSPPPYSGTPSGNTSSANVNPQPSQHSQRSDTSDKEGANIDDVIRYCKHCGAFLREGVNFCPKCGKYVRVSPPSFKQQMTDAQKAAARIRHSTTPVSRIPANIQSNYKEPQEPRYQATQVKQGQSTSSYRPRTTNRSSHSKSTKKNSWLSNFDILSTKGCLIASVVVVILFFIIYFILGVSFDG